MLPLAAALTTDSPPSGHRIARLLAYYRTLGASPRRHSGRELFAIRARHADTAERSRQGVGAFERQHIDRWQVTGQW